MNTRLTDKSLTKKSKKGRKYRKKAKQAEHSAQRAQALARDLAQNTKQAENCLPEDIPFSPPKRRNTEDRSAQDEFAHSINEGEKQEEAEEEGQEEGAEETLGILDHLAELRVRLVRCIVVVGLVFFACYSFSDLLFSYLALPLVKVLPKGSTLIFTGIPEGFFVYLKVAFVAALFGASPYVFYQAWAFIAPGLYAEEKRYIVPLALFSALFFMSGAVFCYFLVFPFAFEFFMSYSTESIVAAPTLNEYLSFSLKLLVAFGLIFEMPLFAFFLARMGIITAKWLREKRRYAVLLSFVVAAILTPPDVISQALMAVPMIILYEISIFVAATFQRAKKEKK